MIRNYFIAAFRSFRKNRVSSMINFLGLTIGVMACLLIVLFADQELRYDDFHEHGDQLYRVALIETQGSSVDESSTNYYGVGEALSEDLPEITDFVTLHDRSAIIKYENENYQEERIFYTESNFLNFFSFPLISGDADKALDSPDKILVTDVMASKYFGDGDPIGKTLVLDDRDRYIVSGVVTCPVNSHIQFDFLLNNQNLLDERYRKDDGIWNWSNFHIYVMTEEGVDPSLLESKFPQILDSHIEEGSGVTWNHLLQPIDEIHLYSDLAWELGPTGNGRMYYSLLFIAFLIMAIAWVNFVNLSIAHASERAKEVGIRKVSGASRWQLISQFLVQSFILNFFAFALALAICQFVKPYFEDLIGQEIQSIGSFMLMHAWMVVVFFVTGVLTSGLYPAMVLSSFTPDKVLKGRFMNSESGISLRKVLTVFQFTASIVLIIGTLMAFKQLNFMRSQNLGFDSNQVLVFQGPSVIDSTYETRVQSFKSELSSFPEILNVSVSGSVPSKEMWGIISGFRRKGVDLKNAILMEIQGFDQDYVDTYEMTMIAGRNFDDGFKTEDKSVLINESGVQALGFESPENAVNKQIQIGSGSDNEFTVVGVINDYHQESLRSEIEPQCILYAPNATDYFSVKIQSDNLIGITALLDEKYASFFPGNPINYFFLDDSLNGQYLVDQRLGKIILLFSSLAIFIACLGLFGLMDFMANKKSREIGIRKVLGASVSNILQLLSKESIVILIISIFIAFPLATYGVNKWLENYAYQTHLEWWVFAVGAGATILIALLTMSYQSLKAAYSNPVDAIKE